MKKHESVNVSQLMKLTSVYATSISVQIGDGHTTLRFGANKQTFSRFNWTVQASSGEGMTVNEGLLIRTLVSTETAVAIKQNEVPPAGEPIPDDILVGTIAITFAVEYFVAGKTMESDDTEFLDNALPEEMFLRDFWPYWHEALTSLALRARMPPIALPPYDLARQHQHLTKAQKARPTKSAGKRVSKKT